MNPLLRVRLRQALADHAEHGGIVDQLARVHGRLGLQAELASPLLTASRNRSPVDICGTP